MIRNDQSNLDRPDSSALSAALVYWRADRPAPTTVHARLLDEGYDASRLERFHRGRRPRTVRVHNFA